MGGMGSGSWYRCSKRTYAEECLRVDIRYMKKQGYLRPGMTGRLAWGCQGEETSSIRFQTMHDSLRLIYRTKQHGGEWQHKDELVNFDWTPCNYGGERQWLRCPHCNKRVAVLYGLNSGFLCRHCYKLSYSSQSEGYLDRMMRKARKIEKILEGNIYTKPKGMHWRTYERLSKEEERINLFVDGAIYNMMNVLEK